MYKQNSEYKSIQKKLVAAIAMVLVACIMVVSSSYAWFTLSTAPEVTGITTSVGSNGNLEMALRTGALGDITDTTNSDGTWRYNTSWGNLVDLSDPSYGLGEISLAPARLNANSNSTVTPVTVNVENLDGYGTETDGKITVTTGATYNGYEITGITKNANIGYDITYNKTTSNSIIDLANDAAQLMTPVYGTDGRISDLGANTSAATFYNGSFAGAGLGVRGIGTISGMSDAQIALRNAKAAVKAAIEKVRTDAQNSMNMDAPKLADMILKYAMDKDSATYNATEVKQVSDAIANLQKIAVNLKDTLDQAVIAVSMSQETEDNPVVTTVTMTSTGFTTDETIEWGEMISIKASLDEAYSDLYQMTEDLQSAQDELPTLAEGATTDFTTLNKSLSYLMDSESMEFYIGEKGPYTAAELKDSVFDLINELMTNNIQAHISKGIYAQIAEFIDNYEGETTMEVDPTSIVSSWTGGPVEKTVELITVVTKPTYGFHLLYANNWLGTVQIAGDGQGGTSISDLYGYIIDLAFRTNAANSSLMLQTSATSRVGDDETLAVQGAGSYMEFTIGHTDYTLDQMVELMKAIRVVFVDETGKILHVACLDMGTTTDETAGTTTNNYEVSEDGKTVKAALRLFNYTINGSGSAIEILDMIPYDNADAQSTAIMDLVQNTPTALSALVYLDGDQVDNGDVAISGNTMTGTLNLQFSSSADLDPMDYTWTENTTTAGTLNPPTASLTGNSLTITADTTEGAPTGVKYDIFTKIGDVEIPLASNVEAGTHTVDLSSAQYQDAELPAGNYKIYVRATLSGYTSSTGVEAGTITVS